MSSDLIIVLGLLVVCIVLFVINKPRMDVVGLLVITVLPLLGILTVNEALAGFSDPSVILIGLLFVIGEGLVRTGVAYQLGDWLVRKAGSSETRLLVLLMLAVAGLGSVMSSTGIVAIFIPVVLSVATKLRISPSRLMMPLSFAGLISGMLTLVATPPNMVMDSALRQNGFGGFQFFSFTPIGLVVLVIGVGYMLIARRWLGGDSDETGGQTKSRRNFQDLIRDYNLAGREHRLRVRPESHLVGQRLQDLNLRGDYYINVVGVERQAKFRTEMLTPRASLDLRDGDVLLVDTSLPKEAMQKVYDDLKVDPLALHGSYFTDQSREVGMAEVSLPPDSSLLDKTVLDANFRRQYSLNVVGMRRNRKALGEDFLEEKLKMGDTLLVIGPWRAIRLLQTQSHDFLVLSLPAEVDEVAPALSQAPYALLSLLVMVALMVTGIVPNVIAALIACLLMGAFKCLDMPSAYRSIHWQSLVLIVGVIPFAAALQKTGGVELAANGLLDMLGSAAGPHLLLASLFILTAVTGLFISNTATAVLMAPVAITTANLLGASPYPFAMTVALAASAAFMTPISSPVNTLVLGPGRYKFGDFVKIGVPFTVIVLGICVLLVPLIFPLFPEGMAAGVPGALESLVEPSASAAVPAELAIPADVIDASAAESGNAAQ